MFVPESTTNRIKVYEQKNAIKKDNKLGSYYISNDKFKSMVGFIVEPGDIIVSCAGTIGEIYTLPQDAEIGIINQALMRIRLFYKPIENYFLMYFDSVLKKEAVEKGNGTGMKNIPPFDILKKMLIPIPPEKEIDRILDKIYSISFYINKINDNNKSINKICLSIKSKILDYFFRENSSDKSYYQTLSLKELCQLSKYNVTKNGNLPYLEAKFIRGVKKPNYVSEGCYIKKGTKIILVDGENSGEVMIAPCDGYLCSTFKVLNLNDSIDENYLMYFIQFHKEILKGNKTGSAVPHLNKKIFNSLMITLPPLNKQKEIAQLFNEIDSILQSIIS